MKPFDSAYLRLSAWYVAIIMVISLLFSVWVYNQAQNELRQGLNRVIELKAVPANIAMPYGGIVSERLVDSSGRLLGQLILLNIGVLLVGSAASYWLARRTMRPIEESVAAQERFTADASHELRTPLAAMKAEIEVGLRDPKLSRSEAVTLLQSNLEEVNRLGGLAEGLLALTQTHDQPIAKTQLALHNAAADRIKRMRPLADAKHITFADELAEVTVLAESSALDKIINILLDNAIKYSPEHTTVTIRTFQKDNHAYLQVVDQGIGIKAGELPHVFDRFYRADTSRSNLQAGGHGLGLAIAHKLVQQLDGDISAQSQPGKGSTFTVRF